MNVKEQLIAEEEAYSAKIKSCCKICDLVIICGIGDWARKLLKFLKERNIRVAGFCVIEKIDGLDSIEDLPIYTLDSTLCMKQKILYLIAVKNDLQNEWHRVAESRNLRNVIDFPDIFRKIKSQVVLNEQRRKPAMEITPLIGCSINCRYCPQSRLLKTYKGSQEMYLKDFKKYLMKIPAEVDIVFSGFVEPFFGKRQYRHDGIRSRNRQNPLSLYNIVRTY